MLRVYIAQVTDGALAPAVAGALHAALDGVAEAGIEVIDLNTEPPPYQAETLPSTDGEWIWTGTATYYLDYYGLAPDAELIKHIDARWRAGRSG